MSNLAAKHCNYWLALHFLYLAMSLCVVAVGKLVGRFRSCVWFA